MADDHGQLSDHSYDGIEEYDNPQPGWWNWLFIVTIVFSIGYWIFYHMGGGGKSELDTYAASVKADEEKKAEVAQGAPKTEMSEESIFAMTTDAALMAQTKDIYLGKCLACHGPDGGGLIGPNFTDDYWIHGAKLTDLVKVITEGVPAKGMIPWKGQLNDNEIMQLAAYIRTLRGTKAATPKEPQGDLWTIDGIKAEKTGGAAPTGAAAPPAAPAPTPEAPAAPAPGQG
ncbi:MAG: c-type cytochrome [Deltaproteobacteria bacterium]|nr:c-type cytochrome [Deltaproteobacteria bacterium]